MMSSLLHLGPCFGCRSLWADRVRPPPVGTRGQQDVAPAQKSSSNRSLGRFRANRLPQLAIVTRVVASRSGWGEWSSPAAASSTIYARIASRPCNLGARRAISSPRSISVNSVRTASGPGTVPPSAAAPRCRPPHRCAGELGAP